MMRREQANALHIASITDLVRHLEVRPVAHSDELP